MRMLQITGIALMILASNVNELTIQGDFSSRFWISFFMFFGGLILSILSSEDRQ